MQPEQAVPIAAPPTPGLVPVVACPGAGRLRVVRWRTGALVQRLAAAVPRRLPRQLVDDARCAVGGRVGNRARVPAVLRARANAADTREVSLPLDGRGPGAARTVLDGLRDRIAPSVLRDAQMVVSELVTNAVRHSGISDGGIVVLCVTLTGTMVRLDVTDPGCGGVIAPRAPDFQAGGGFGLHLVRALSERWGLEQVAAGGTRVWAQLPRVPTAAPGEASRRASMNGEASERSAGVPPRRVCDGTRAASQSECG
jgi:anti-sigma regulatory factor (Ser/Thr protein kinase)